MTCSLSDFNHKEAFGLASRGFCSLPSLSSAVIPHTTADELMPKDQLVKTMSECGPQTPRDYFDDFCFDNNKALGPSCISKAASVSNYTKDFVGQRESSLKSDKSIETSQRSNQKHYESDSSYYSGETNCSSSQSTSTPRSSRNSQHIYFKPTPPVSMDAPMAVELFSENEQGSTPKIIYTSLTPKSSRSFAGLDGCYKVDKTGKQKSTNEGKVAKSLAEGTFQSYDHQQLPESISFSSISPSVQNGSPLITKSLENLRKKQNAVRELFFTERQFAQDMAVVVRIYMCGSAGIGLSMRQIDTLFSNVTHVLDLSLSMVATLETQIPAQILQNDVSLGSMDIEADKELLVGKAMCLVLNGQFYEVYETYIHNNPIQMSLCYSLTKDLANQHSGKAKSGSLAQVDRQELAMWLQRSNQRAEKFTNAWSLDSLLIKPIQRLGKYPLLLKTILQYTESSHEDYEYLQKALKRSIQYLDCVNARFGVA